MAVVSAFAVDVSDVAGQRKISFASSLRGFRPLTLSPKHKSVPRLRSAHYDTAQSHPLHETALAERSWREAEIRTEASVSLQRGTLRRSVSTASPLRHAPSPIGHGVWFGAGFGVLVAFVVQSLIARLKGRVTIPALVTPARQIASTNGTSLPTSEDGETIEWVNMCWRKIWRVYQQGLEKWLAGVLQPVFDKVVNEGAVPRILKGIKIVELTFDHQAPYLSNLRRRTSRKDSDLNGVVDVRYTGGARMLLMLEVGAGRWFTKVPVLVSDLDLECQLWLKVRLAPLTPYLGTLSFAFVGPPNIKVQLAPYNSVRLMRIPVLQNFLTRLLTKVLPGLMVLPKRLEINIPPAITAVAEAAVGRDAVMKAVASAVLQADALEQSLIAVLPLGPQSAAGGITLPKSFQGELSVALIEGRNLPIWGFPWQSNPYCRLTLGKQAVLSKRENDTGTKGGHRQPIWNQDFEFLVENLEVQTLEVYIKDSPITGRPEVGKVEFPLSQLPKDGSLSIWLPVQQVNPGQDPMGELHLDISYKPFVDEDFDSGYVEAENYAKRKESGEGGEEITDIKSAAAASSKAAAAATAAFSAIATTRAAAARAAHRAQMAALAATKMAKLGGSVEEESDSEDEEMDFDPDTYDLEEMREATENGVPDEATPSDLSPMASQNGSPVETNGAVEVAADVQEAAEKLASHPEGVRDAASLEEVTPVEPLSSPSTSDSLPVEPSLNGSTGVEALDSAPSEIEQNGSSEPWWTHVVRGRSHDVAQELSSDDDAGSMEAAATRPQKKDRIHWWMWLTSSIAFWRRRSQIISTDSPAPKPSKSPKRRKTDESVILPPELPLEEIAKEVVRLKTVTDRDEEERMNRVYAEAAEQSDRKWIMLLCFLIALSIGMLSVVAMRIGPI